jgi:predicted phosphodiesterase
VRPNSNTNRAPVSSPIALISDVHGNLEALEAVLAELARRAVTELYVAGDLLLGGAAPLEVWRRLLQVGAHCVSGPSDLALARIDPESLIPMDAEQRARWQDFADTRRKLGDMVLHQLARLPDRLRVAMLSGGELLVVHGSPSDPSELLSHDLDDEELEDLLGNEAAEIVACGGTHVPFERQVGEVRVVNVGSVGESPEGRVAHFTILMPRADGADVEQSWVEY